MTVTIVIPIHNEAGNIQQLVEELDAVLNPPIAIEEKVGANWSGSSLLHIEHEMDLPPIQDNANPPPSTEVLFINDASIDHSGEILNQLAQQYNFMRVIHLPNRAGQTGCYQVAFKEAKSDYIIRMDGDLQDDPRDLPKFFELLEQDPDVIMGLRSLRRHRRMLRIVTLLYDILMLSLFDTPFHTNSSSFIAYKAKFVKNISFKRNDHRYLPIIAIHRGAKNLYEISIKNRDRKYGKTKYGYYSKFLKGIPEVLRFLLRLKRGYYDLSHNLSGDSK